MDTSDEAVAAAKRSLDQRIERYLLMVEGVHVRLGPWETDQLCKALACLETGSYLVGDEVMLQLELAGHRKPDPATAPSNGPALTVHELRGTLQQIRSED